MFQGSWIVGTLFLCHNTSQIWSKTGHKADPKHHSGRMGNRLFLVLFAAWEVTVRNLRSKAQGLTWLLLKNLADISVRYVAILLRFSPFLETVDIALLSLECLLFGLSIFYFFFLWAFSMLFFINAIQSKIWDKFWTHLHVNHIYKEIQHAAFARAKRPRDHGHGCIRGTSRSTNHLCRCKWKDKIRNKESNVNWH